MSYSPAQMASMLEVVKDTPPVPELPLGGWLAELDGMTLKYAFERKVGELLWEAQRAFSTARLDLKLATAQGGDVGEAWSALIAAADILAAELRCEEK